MINPYEGVDFSTCQKIKSVSHQHLSHNQDTPSLTQSGFDELYAFGVRHFCFSRYRPSINTYPFDYTSQKFVYVANPEDATETGADLVREYGREISFAGKNDVIGSPNAEHPYSKLLINGAWTKWNSIHINGIGSRFESGTVPDPDYSRPSDAGTYEQCLDGIFGKLQFPDGGGAIINHPQWTQAHIRASYPYDFERFLMDCLDYDQRVLGTDISESKPQSRIADNMALWDRILCTGRRCWGFGEGDWNRDVGRNELLIPAGVTDKEDLEHECLKAYRNGRFFSRWGNTALTLTGVSYSAGTYTVTTSGADHIQIIVDGVGQTVVDGNTATATGLSEATYVRAIAYTDGSGDDAYEDIIFVQPIMINPQRYHYDPAYAEAVPVDIQRRSIMRSMLWS